MTDLYKIRPLVWEVGTDGALYSECGSYKIAHDPSGMWVSSAVPRGGFPDAASAKAATEKMDAMFLDKRLTSVPDAAEPFRLALTPSPETKVAYWGEFKMPVTQMVEDDDGEPQEETHEVYVPWDVVKQIMAGIRAFAERGMPEGQMEKADG